VCFPLIKKISVDLTLTPAISLVLNPCAKVRQNLQKKGATRKAPTVRRRNSGGQSARPYPQISEPTKSDSKVKKTGLSSKEQWPENRKRRIGQILQFSFPNSNHQSGHRCCLSRLVAALAAPSPAAHSPRSPHVYRRRCVCAHPADTACRFACMRTPPYR